MRIESHAAHAVLALATWGLTAGAGSAMAASPAASTATAGDVQRGAAIYQTGRRADGTPVQAQRLGAGSVAPSDAACASCHRPSGMGQREGRLLVPAIAGHILFAPLHRPTVVRANPNLQHTPLRAYDRPAYTNASLATALRSGRDVVGRPLDAAMPRYALSRQDAADLQAYLGAISSRSMPGVVGGVLHLATVLAPDAPPPSYRAVETAVAAWAQQLSLGAWQVKWSPWRLSGPASGWAAQLSSFWQAQPVFAMVSGAGGWQWAPVAQFCEAKQIPCVFPSLAASPDGAAQAHFNFYLSAGVRAEAAMLGRWAAQALPPPRQLIQVVADSSDQTATLAAQGLARTNAAPLPLSQSGQAPSDPGALAGALETAIEGDVVVLWGNSDTVSTLLKQTPPKPGVRLCLSAMLAPAHRVELPAAWRPQVMWTSVHSDSVRRNAGAALSAAPWARGLNLPEDLDPVVLSEVHAATFFFTDALARMREGLQAEYFNERLEDAVDMRPASAGFFRLSLGPKQRIAAQGGHMLGYGGPGADQLRPISPYLRAN